VAERLVVGSLPFLRLGLANVVTVVVLVGCGAWYALLVTGLRVVASGVLTGTLLGPTFAMALAGGLGAWVVMSGVWVGGRWVIGPLGLSVLGALSHNVCQVATASVVALGTWELASLWPLIALVSAAAGTVTGLLALAMGRTLFPDQRRDSPFARKTRRPGLVCETVGTTDAALSNRRWWRIESRKSGKGKGDGARGAVE
jgi:heptaprenyl diphosphate synthase